MVASTPAGGSEYVLVNIDNGLQVAGRVRLAGDSGSRRRGLLGVNALDRESGLWIVPCEAIHTFGMRMPIDLLFLDRGFKVRKLLKDVRPWRIAVCLRASSVVELRAGAIAESKTKVGDCLSVQRTAEGGGIQAEETMSLGSQCPSS